MSELAIALVHYPVRDRQGDTVTTAITNLDLHDLARSARTYGATAVFVVHPIAAQRLLAERVRAHWVEGAGQKRIPDRRTALEILRVVPALEDAYAALGGREAIEVWTTAASARDGAVETFAHGRERLAKAGKPTLILFGTGWGLTREVVQGADVRLEPIRAASDSGFNHLSVRAACAITLDRLRG